MSCGVPGHLMQQVPTAGDNSKIILDKAPTHSLLLARTSDFPAPFQIPQIAPNPLDDGAPYDRQVIPPSPLQKRPPRASCSISCHQLEDA
jgi:hypothetical protein